MTNIILLNWFSTIISFLKDISVLVASGVGLYGINSWRRQIKWKKKHDLAEETLIAFYNAQESFNIIRHPISFGNEGSSRLKNQNETTEESMLLNERNIVTERYETYKEPFLKLKVLKQRFKTLFNKESLEPFDDFNSILNKILLSNSLYYDRKRDKKLNDYNESTLATINGHMSECESVFRAVWVSSTEDEGKDDIKNKINKSVEQMETCLQKYLQEQDTLYEKIKRLIT